MAIVFIYALQRELLLLLDDMVIDIANLVTIFVFRKLFIID